MSQSWSAHAPGKLILAGEHAVVYGHLAVAAAVSLQTTVTLRARPGPSGLARDTAPAFLGDPRLAGAVATVLPPDGLEVHVVSDLPVGCGMGSSAALAVALVRAIAAREGRVLDEAACFDQAFPIERAFHGTPSGIDHAVSANGGVVAYRRAPDAAAVPQMTSLRVPAPLTLVVVDTGTPGDTAAMVRAVRHRRDTNPHAAAALDEIGSIAEGVAEALPGGNLRALGSLLDANHAVLQRIGVSTPRLDVACAILRSNGALGAKLAGAGGGGVCFGLADGAAMAARLQEAVAPLGMHAFVVRIGETT